MKSSAYHLADNPQQKRESRFGILDCCLLVFGTALLLSLFFAGFLPKPQTPRVFTSVAPPSTGSIAQQHVTFETVPVDLPESRSAQFVLGPFTFDHPVALTSFDLELKNDSNVHHLIVYRSTQAYLPGRSGAVEGEGVAGCCRPENVVYAWAKSAKSKATRAFQTFPDTGFILNSPPNDEKHLYLGAHFEPSSNPGNRRESIKLRVGYKPLVGAKKRSVAPLSVGVIYATRMYLRPNLRDAQVCVSCMLRRDLTVTAFRNHAHSAARLIESHVYRGGIFYGVMGSRSAQEAQVFVPSDQWHNSSERKTMKFREIVELHEADMVFLRCHYNTTGRRHITNLGLDPKLREMCNQYLMYFPYEHDDWASCRTVDCQDESAIKKTYQAEASNFQLPELGQVAGVAQSQDGNSLFVFARRENNYFSKTKIQSNTIFHIDTNSGKTVNAFGKGLFATPHGIYLDAHNVLWVTDTSLHQVFALDASTGKVILELGVARVAGKGKAGFNGPTDVVVSDKREVFISDGYGNSRIVVYTYDGKYVREWGGHGAMPGQFNIPHGIDLDERGVVYVADRENSRIQLFNQSGALLGVWESGLKPEGDMKRPWLHHLSAVTYSQTLRILFSIEGNDMVGRRIKDGFEVLRWSSPTGDRWPHDITIARSSLRNLDVFVAELFGKRVQRYSLKP